MDTRQTNTDVVNIFCLKDRIEIESNNRITYIELNRDFNTAVHGINVGGHLIDKNSPIHRYVLDNSVSILSFLEQHSLLRSRMLEAINMLGMKKKRIYLWIFRTDTELCGMISNILKDVIDVDIIHMSFINPPTVRCEITESCIAFSSYGEIPLTDKSIKYEARGGILTTLSKDRGIKNRDRLIYELEEYMSLLHSLRIDISIQKDNTSRCRLMEKVIKTVKDNQSSPKISMYQEPGHITGMLPPEDIELMSLISY